MNKSPRSELSAKGAYSEAVIFEILQHLDGRRQAQIKEEIEERGGVVDMLDFVRLLKGQLSGILDNGTNIRKTLATTEEELVGDLCELFRAIDVNGDGTLEWDEFTAFVVEKASLHRATNFHKGT